MGVLVLPVVVGRWRLYGDGATWCWIGTPRRSCGAAPSRLRSKDRARQSLGRSSTASMTGLYNDPPGVLGLHAEPGAAPVQPAQKRAGAAKVNWAGSAFAPFAAVVLVTSRQRSRCLRSVHVAASLRRARAFGFLRICARAAPASGAYVPHSAPPNRSR